MRSSLWSLSSRLAGYVLWTRDPGWGLRLFFQGGYGVIAVAMGLWYRQQHTQVAARNTDDGD